MISEDEFDNLKKDVKAKSSKRFGVVRSKVDFLLFALLGAVAAGVACFAAWPKPLATRLIAMSCAAVTLLSVVSIYRTAVPFALRISYADMMRLRRPFYIWMCCVAFVICLSDSFFSLFSVPRTWTAYVVLAAVAVNQVLWYLRDGRLWHLFVSALLAGVAIGLSAFGVVVLVLVLSAACLNRQFVLSQLENGEERADETFRPVMDQMLDVSTMTMVRLILCGCFFVGALAVVAARLIRSGSFHDAFGCGWMCGLSAGGGLVLVTVGVLPLIFALNGVAKATDTMEVFSFENQVKYLLIALLSVCFLLAGEMIFRKTLIPFEADSSYWLLGIGLAGFALLTSATAVCVDVWCRVSWAARRRGVGRDDQITAFCQLMLVAVPIALVLVAGFIRLRACR